VSGVATARIALPVFIAAFAVDLLTKQWAVSRHLDRVVFNHRASELPFRIAMSFVAVAVAAVLARLAARRGLGRQRGVWVGCGLLLAGVLGNGLSPIFWSRGVPDFIHLPDGSVGNLADFEITFGVAGGILSVAVAAVLVYAREALARRRAEETLR
jgi:lipoprotein signal peptidase